MAYGDYSGTDKPDKGKEGGSCNRGRCQCAPARWYNHGSYAWYCDDCMDQIYDAVGKRHWAKDFPDAGHPMFETRKMMDERLNPPPAPNVRGCDHAGYLGKCPRCGSKIPSLTPQMIRDTAAWCQSEADLRETLLFAANALEAANVR